MNSMESSMWRRLYVRPDFAIEKLQQGKCVNEIGIKYSSLGCDNNCIKCYQTMLEECNGKKVKLSTNMIVESDTMNENCKREYECNGECILNISAGFDTWSKYSVICTGSKKEQEFWNRASGFPLTEEEEKEFYEINKEVSKNL